MKKAIEHKLDRIDMLFPPERLGKSKERWKRLWQGAPPIDRVPFMLNTAGVSYYSANMTAEEKLEKILDHLILRGRIEDDFIPSLFTGCHQGAIPSMFGAKEVVLGEDYTCERLLTNVEEASSLVAEIKADTVAMRWIEMQRYFMAETAGRLPVHVTDMQGPFDVAGQLLGYENVFLAAYDDRPAYDLLLRKTTSAFIDYWRAQADVVGELFLGTHLWAWSWVPPEVGASVSVDSLVMFSPDFYEDAVRPYLEIIAETFGGVVTHSCGNFSGVMPALVKTKGLKGVNGGQMTLKEMVDAGLTKELVASLHTSITSLPETLELMAQGYRAELTIAGVWPNGKPADWQESQWDAVQEKVANIEGAMQKLAQ